MYKVSEIIKLIELGLHCKNKEEYGFEEKNQIARLKLNMKTITMMKNNRDRITNKNIKGDF